MMDAILSVTQILGTVFVAWHSFCSALYMSRKTNHGIRAGIILMGSGALYEAMITLAGHVPDPAEMLVILGLCLITFFNRRAAQCPCVVYHPTRCGCVGVPEDCQCSPPTTCTRASKSRIMPDK
jgi:hypothetical protein